MKEKQREKERVRYGTDLAHHFEHFYEYGTDRFGGHHRDGRGVFGVAPEVRCWLTAAGALSYGKLWASLLALRFAPIHSIRFLWQRE